MENVIQKWKNEDVDLLNLLSEKINSKTSRFRARLLRATYEELNKRRKEAEASGEPVPDKRIQDHFETETAMVSVLAETNSGKVIDHMASASDGPYLPLILNVFREINSEGLKGG